MTTPIWLQTLKSSTNQGTKDFAALFNDPGYTRTLDQINRSQILQQDIIDFATGTGRFAGYGPGNFTTEGIAPAGGEYRSASNTLAIGAQRLQGIYSDGTTRFDADPGPVIAHEIQHAFNRADLNNLPTRSDPGFTTARSPNVVWNNLLDEGEAQLRQYRVAKEIYERELLNYEVDPSAPLPVIRMDALRVSNIDQWLADGNELYRHGLIPSVDYLARANLAVEIVNSAKPSNAGASNYVDYYSNDGMPSAGDAQRMQHLEITGIGNGKVSVVFSSIGDNPSAILFSQPFTAGAEGAWNAEVCRFIPLVGTGGTTAPSVLVNGQQLTVTEAVTSDIQGETSVTEYQSSDRVISRYDSADNLIDRTILTTDQFGNTNAVATNAVGQVISQTHTDYFHDGSRLETITTPDGKVVQKSFESDNQPTSITTITDVNGDGIYDQSDFALFDKQGILNGRIKDLSDTESQPATPSTDPISNKLQDVRQELGSKDKELVRAAELRAIGGAQTEGEAWGGAHLMAAGESALGEYYRAALDFEAQNPIGTGTGSTTTTAPPALHLDVDDGSDGLGWELDWGYDLGLGLLGGFGLGGGAGVVNDVWQSQEGSYTAIDWGYVGSTTGTGTTNAWNYDSYDYGSFSSDWGNWSYTDYSAPSYSYSNSYTSSYNTYDSYDYGSIWGGGWDSGWDSGWGSGYDSYDWDFFAPVALDLDGDGIELVKQADSQAWYDVVGDGQRRHIGWLGKDDGFLAIDDNADGHINLANELSFALWTAEPANASNAIPGLVRMTETGGRVYGLATGSAAVSVDLGSAGLDAVIGGAGNAHNTCNTSKGHYQKRSCLRPYLLGLRRI